MKSPYRGGLLVVGSIIGGAVIQLTMWACGSVTGSPDARAADAVPGIDALAAGDVWSSYTPTITSDGAPAASAMARGGAIRYVEIGKTVCLQGFVAFGETSPGTGGTFIKISVPPGLPGAAGVSQYGIGAVSMIGSPARATTGAAAIETDVNNFVLAKEITGYFVDGDAPLNVGFTWTASGCYQTD